MPASQLKVRYRGKVVLAGPEGSEETARARLETALYESLSECAYLDHSGRAAHYASVVAEKVPYVVRGRKIVVRADLDFYYRNPPGDWKHWASVLKTEEDE